MLLRQSALFSSAKKVLIRMNFQTQVSTQFSGLWADGKALHFHDPSAGLEGTSFLPGRTPQASAGLNCLPCGSIMEAHLHHSEFPIFYLPATPASPIGKDSIETALHFQASSPCLRLLHKLCSHQADAVPKLEVAMQGPAHAEASGYQEHVHRRCPNAGHQQEANHLDPRCSG
jgi:hypothetical protein